MSIRNLKHLFNPQSVAVIGASRRPQRVGTTVLHNIIEAGYRGQVYPVNPKYSMLDGLETYARVRDLPVAPELAVICTPPATVPQLIDELGTRGTRAAIVLTAGLGAIKDRKGRSLKQAMLDAARPHLLRILGPNCVGMLTPRLGLNASFAHIGAIPGRLAFVSQSGALMTGVLDWAASRGIGFSRFISLGESADIDFADLIDYLASDMETQAILLYIEDIRHARKFMSAARAAARSKPVVVIKAGHASEGARAAASHTGAIAGSDAVYDAAIRRAGMLRVLTTSDLFGAVETLARARPLHGDRLTIMTNGGGPGVMATDALVDQTGRMATLSENTLRELDAVLPATWSHGNPVDIIGDAPVERYVDTMKVLLRDPQSDAILFIHAPSAIVPSSDIAQQLVPLATQASRNIIACWLGGEGVAMARHIFAEAGIPTYDTPEAAVRAFMQIVQYRRNQKLLIEVPPTLATDFTPDREAAQATIRNALDQGVQMLSEPDAKALLAAYGIPVVATRRAAHIEEAVQCAQEIGFPVAVKILSPDITHKSDVGGVVLDLETTDAVRSAATAMHKRLQALQPEARLDGFTVQSMARRPQGTELIVGVSTDPVFGPVILFGHGGVAVEVTGDHAIGLPPLNMVLAREMVSRTRVAKLLAGYRNRPAADMGSICRTLVQVSQLVADLAEVVELDINPLLADDTGAIALDARVRIAPVAAPMTGAERFAIRPYPQELEAWVTWQNESLLLRPIRPEDGAAHLEFFNALDPDDVRYRMFVRMRELQASQLARLTQIDYDREMAFIASRKRPDGRWETLGVSRAIADPDNMEAEFAVIVRSDLKRLGLGRILMEQLIAYCRSRGTQWLVGEAFSQNRGVLRLSESLGFETHPSEEPGTTMMRLDLTKQPATEPASFMT